MKLKITFNSPAVLTFSLIALVVTVLGVVSHGTITEQYFMTYRGSLSNPMTYVRAITYVFGHSGWEHFLGNVSYILLLGPMLEEKYGSKTLGIIMFITAIVTAVINFIFTPGVGLMGASGIVFAFIILASFTGFRNGEIPLTFILVAAIYIGQQIYEGIFVIDNVSNMAHIVGGAVGSVLGYTLNRRG